MEAFIKREGDLNKRCVPRDGDDSSLKASAQKDAHSIKCILYLHLRRVI